jgi:serine/threonine protein kinase
MPLAMSRIILMSIGCAYSAKLLLVRVPVFVYGFYLFNGLEGMEYLHSSNIVHGDLRGVRSLLS